MGSCTLRRARQIPASRRVVPGGLRSSLALVVSGQLRHTTMTPAAVSRALSPHIPGLGPGGLELVVRRRDCEVTLFCNTASTLDFAITTRAGGLSAPATVALLVREAESLHLSLRKGLRRRMRSPVLQYCVLEDERSRSQLLSMSEEKPLSSSGAKASYLLCLLLLLLAGGLTFWQLQQPPNADRSYNVVSLLIGLVPPALTLPLPFLWEWFRSHGNPRWFFTTTTSYQ